MNLNVYIIGTSGFAAEITEYIENNHLMDFNPINIVGYFDIDQENFNKYHLPANFLGLENNFKFQGQENIIIAIADPEKKEKIYHSLKKNECVFPKLIHHSCFISKNSEIEEGAVLCPFVTVTSNAKIGKNFHANIYSYIAHDCIIGDNVTFSPGVKCNGYVEIGNNVYIGSGVIIKHGTSKKPIKIGNNVAISAGSVVTKSLESGKTYFGNPAVELTKENMKRRG